MNKNVLAIVGDIYEDLELWYPKLRLEEAGYGMRVPAMVITASLLERFRSRDSDSFVDKLLAAMRNQFGGHEIKTE